VYAATLTTTNGQFYSAPWTGAGGGIDRIDGDSSHFFDGRSIDSRGTQSSGCNIGYYIQGTGSGCNNQPGNIDRINGANYNGPGRGTAGLPYLGSSATANEVDFAFSPQSPVFTVQLMAEANLFHASTSLGVYTKDPAGNVTAQLILFAGADTPGKTVSFTPGASAWGFYFVTGFGTYYTERLLGDDAGMQHFAVFKDARDAAAGLGFTKLWIGAEWSPEWLGAADYNDMIFTLVCNNCQNTTDPGELRFVPEPDTFTTFGIGALLILTAAALRRLRGHHSARSESATLRRGTKAHNHTREPHTHRFYTDCGRSVRMAAGSIQTAAAECDAVGQ
jgi:hypothetical protein